MKKVLMALLCCVLVSPMFAKNEIHYFSLKDALEKPEDSSLLGYLDANIPLVFGSGYKGKVILKDVRSNKKSNGFGKSDRASCERALYSALKSMQERAVREGGSKVVNITGYYYKQPFDSKTEFQCGVGNIVSGVTLRGDIAK